MTLESLQGFLLLAQSEMPPVVPRGVDTTTNELGMSGFWLVAIIVALVAVVLYVSFNGRSSGMNPRV